MATAVSGSGPACAALGRSHLRTSGAGPFPLRYVFLMIEAMIDAAVASRAGFPLRRIPT